MIRFVNPAYLARVTIVALGLAVATSPALAGDRPEPHLARNHVQEATAAGFDVLRQYPEDSAQRRGEFLEMADSYFDLDTIAKLALGVHRRAMTPDQMMRYKPVFEAFLAGKYSALLGGYNGEAIDIIEVTDSGRRDVLVHSSAKIDGERFHVAWRLRNAGESPRIIDVQIENISFLISLREELDSVIRREGIDGLIGRLADLSSDVPVQHASADASSL